MITIYRTEVLDLPPTPLGLLPRRFRVQHTCTLCLLEVDTDQLIGHAQAHADGPAARDNAPESLT